MSHSPLAHAMSDSVASSRPNAEPVPTTLSVPALHTQLPIVRMLTEVVAMHSGCTLDQVSDLKLAVDQVCTLLIDAADPHSGVSCSYRVVGDDLHVSVTATTVAHWRPASDSLEWRILELLTDTVTAGEEPAESGGGTVSTVEFTLAKPA